MSRPNSVEVGETYPTNKYGDVEVLAVQSSQKIRIVFKNTGGVTWIRASSLRKGVTKDKLALLDIAGYLGEGPYSYSQDTKAYQCWRNMLRRCYDVKNEKYCSYGGVGVYVAEDWHNFQNFARWWYDQHKDLLTTIKYELDKDADCAYCYSEKHCIMLPSAINIFIKKNITEITQGVYADCSVFRTRLFTVEGVYESCYNYQQESDAWLAWYSNRCNKLEYLEENYNSDGKYDHVFKAVRNRFNKSYQEIKDKVRIK